MADLIQQPISPEHNSGIAIAKQQAESKISQLQRQRSFKRRAWQKKIAKANQLNFYVIPTLDKSVFGCEFM